MVSLIASTNLLFIVGLHLKANEKLAPLWFDGITNNYAGNPVYSDDGDVTTVYPLEVDGKYVFPLSDGNGDHTELFLELEIITPEILEEFGI